ncbi:hypothetical protein IW261DRAFT_1594957 [Armillaria novae-zelandiae]|uniref:Uncharacterized protein n=1 Tax=Armillaria novae-zelandiae TaxID=153914 RepID=A0AA39P4B4_9AGAR|nr:hypothetical protein IW261DRAFT_1594957 [Armillaria novae-zelandiae]
MALQDTRTIMDPKTPLKSKDPKSNFFARLEVTRGQTEPNIRFLECFQESVPRPAHCRCIATDIAFPIPTPRLLGYEKFIPYHKSVETYKCLIPLSRWFLRKNSARFIVLNGNQVIVEKN